MRASACGPDLKPENRPSQTPPHKASPLCACQRDRDRGGDGDLDSAWVCGCGCVVVGVYAEIPARVHTRIPTCVRARWPDLRLILLAQIKPLVQDSVPPALSRGVLVNVRRTFHGPQRGRRSSRHCLPSLLPQAPVLQQGDFSTPSTRRLFA